MSSRTTNPKPPATGTDAAAKEAGFKHFKEFLECYGLNLQDPDDIEEGKAILRSMGYLK
jgi:hypothetical protein